MPRRTTAVAVADDDPIEPAPFDYEDIYEKYQVESGRQIPDPPPPPEAIFITPEMVSIFLKHMGPNRRLDAGTVDKYARDLERDRFFSQNTFLFTSEEDPEWGLEDGQHRLHAVRKTGIGAWFFIHRGVSKDEILAVDIGRSRTAAQQGSRVGITDAASKYSAARRLLAMKHAGWAVGPGSSYNPSNAEQTDVALAPWFLKGQYWALHLCGKKVRKPGRQSGLLVNKTATWVAYVVLHEIDPDGADRFFNDLYTGANLSPRDPVLTLRNRIINGKATEEFGSGGVADGTLYLMIKAWNHRVRGETPAKLQSYDSDTSHNKNKAIKPEGYAALLDGPM